MEQTRALISLFGKEFLIPHYQRGYRWEDQEVEELLDDLWNFEKTSNKGEFYCLQPIVLQENGKDTFAVLDGQQRLTTLYLILNFLEDFRKESGYNQPLFTIKYETRTDCEEFLEKKKFLSGDDDSNIDYYHISNAYKCIKNWFADPKHAGARMKLIPILMDKNDKGNRNVRFIWYTTELSVNPIEIFIRLNIGKIPLTDAELIKALLLQSDRYDRSELKFVEKKLFEIATEWDSIEYTLQDNDFWYFLNNNNNTRPTHIEFILDLIADSIYREKKYFERKPLKHSTFLILSKYLEDLLDIDHLQRIDAVEKIWKKVAEYFEYFRNWYMNRKLFHYIGYLITVRGNQLIDILIAKSKILSKKEFIIELERQIGESIHISKKRKDSNGVEYSVTLQDLNYENEDQKSHDRAEIRQILLLHNVHSSLKSDKEQARFPFGFYKETITSQRWSLEHIHAQNSAYLIRKDGQSDWLRDHIRSLKNHDNLDFELLIVEMEEMQSLDEIDKIAFESLVDKVYYAMDKLSDMKQDSIHSISNLCLMDSYTNSQLNNSVFDVKREKIKIRESQGHYIPVCTRNVFMKAYSHFPVSNAYWAANDRNGYIESIRKVYDYYTNGLN